MLHWKLKPMVVLIVLVVLAALVAGYFDGGPSGNGMYWS